MAKLTEAEKRKNFERTVGSSENDMGPLPELEPKQYSPKNISSKTPEPTFKSDVDNMVSGVKKVDNKINEALTPVRKVMVKAAGKEEPGLLGKYSGLSKNLSELKKKKGGVIKDLKKAGFYDAKEDKAKRLDIINKVTTKPERIEMVDKMFSAKKMSNGGTASSRADGCAVRGKTRA
jgi:hypothetical protein